MIRLSDSEIVGLTSAGLLTRDLPANTSSPWMLKLLLGGAAWLAALFVIGFIMLLFEPDTEAEAGALGVVLVAGAALLFTVSRSMFVEQVALAASLAGQGFVLFAVAKAFDIDTPRAGAFVACAIQVAVFLLLPNHLSRMLSAFFAALAWAVGWRLGWLDWNGTPQPGLSGLIDWGFGVVPIAAFVAALVLSETRWLTTPLSRWLLPATTSLIAALCVAPIVLLPIERSAIVGGDGVGLAPWPILSFVTALGALAAARYLGSAALMALAIVSAILSVVAFYYELSMPLLAKSLLMLAMAALAFAAHAVLRKREVA